MSSSENKRKMIEEMLNDTSPYNSSGESFHPSGSSSDDSDSDSDYENKNNKLSAKLRKSVSRNLFKTDLKTALASADILNTELISVSNTMLPHFDDKLNEKCTITTNEDRGTDIIVQMEETSSGLVISSSSPKKRTRKRVSKPQNWACNILKAKHQSGQAYIGRRGNSVPEKTIKSIDCLQSCIFKCSCHISKEEQRIIFKSYYSLNNNEKHHFLLNTTDRALTARKSRRNDENESRRKYSFRYFFVVKTERIRVCKKFYLGVLDISQKPVYNVHINKDICNIPKSDGRGKSETSLRNIPNDKKDRVRAHIASFPCVESHYCRASTNKKYLESNLNIKKMYDMYASQCKDEDIVPVKESMYRKIFLTEYNLDFHKPKSDRCDLCEAYESSRKQSLLTESITLEYEKHIAMKVAMRNERQRDKDNNIVPVLCFDLENVITCPRADISSFFYKRKLNVYNLTAHLSTTKTVYCAIWTEATSGRAGNDIASAFRKILDCVVEDNELTDLITWSDSCVPQNRNSIISNAVLDFMRDHPYFNSITMKYSVPGHSCIQVVDNAHSNIEKAFQKNEFFSPIGLVRILKTINRKHPYRVIQMSQKDFKDYTTTAKLLNYKEVPYSKISFIKFTQCHHIIEYKLSHEENVQCTIVNLKYFEKPSRQPQQEGGNSVLDIRPKINLKSVAFPDMKKNDIKSMLKFMPVQDRQYYSVLLKI